MQAVDKYSWHLKKTLLSTVSVDYVFCYYSEKCKTNLFILLLLWLGMISTYMPHKFIKAFPPYVNYVVTLPVKFVRFYVILLLLIFPDKVIT